MRSFDDDENNAKKFKKRQILSANKFKGKMAEKSFESEQRLKGYDVKHQSRGPDYVLTRKDPHTGKSVKEYREIKSSSTAPESPLQKAEKKRLGSRYKVIRSNW